MTDKIKIPIYQNENSKNESLINGLYSTIHSFKDILFERIDRLEKNINIIDNKPVKDYTEDINTLRNEISSLNNLFLQIEKIKDNIIERTNNHTQKIFKDNFDELIPILNSSVDSYFKNNEELHERFKVIEKNTVANIDGLKEFIKLQPHDPLDYLFITENFNKIIGTVGELKKQVSALLEENKNMKCKNQYIYEAIYIKELPIAEFTNYTKAIVYKYGLRKKIAFFKNDGKRWIKIC